jgi:hypothetical protein
MRMAYLKKPATFWATLALVAILVGYPLSFGPAFWVSSQLESGTPFVTSVYKPILRAWLRGPAAVRAIIIWYARLGAKPDWDFT